MEYKNKRMEISDGEYEHEFGAYMADVDVMGGFYGSYSFKNSENVVYKDGDFDHTTGMHSNYSIFKNGTFGDYTGFESENTIVIGGSYGSNTLEGAENVKVYIENAQSVYKPESGYLIAGKDVGEIYTEDRLEKLCVYTTKDNVRGDYNEKTTRTLLPSELEEILDEVNFNHFKDIEDYETLSLAMEQLICRVDEVSLPYVNLDIWLYFLFFL